MVFRSALARSNALVLAAMLLVMASFTWRSFVTETHLDLPVSSHVAPGLSPDDQRLVSEKAPPAHPADCPICREMAVSGHFLPPAPVALSLPAPSAAIAAVARVLHSSGFARSHRWQSRAPPRLSTI